MLHLAAPVRQNQRFPLLLVLMLPLWLSWVTLLLCLVLFTVFCLEIHQGGLSKGPTLLHQNSLLCHPIPYLSCHLLWAPLCDPYHMLGMTVELHYLLLTLPLWT
jgi:hypothetical protein